MAGSFWMTVAMVGAFIITLGVVVLVTVPA